MVYIIQLIYLKEGQEEVFEQFEAVAIPSIKKYEGRMLLRVRPPTDAYITRDIEEPYEIHIAEFPSASQFDAYLEDEERKRFLHLKEKSIRAAFFIRGTRL
ncbi:MAG TPA: DUF1330 domain-containing protein [Chitinophagaceae bacterium]